MPEFYIIIARTFFPIFFLGGARALPCPSSPTPVVYDLYWHELCSKPVLLNYRGVTFHIPKVALIEEDVYVQINPVLIRWQQLVYSATWISHIISDRKYRFAAKSTSGMWNSTWNCWTTSTGCVERDYGGQTISKEGQSGWMTSSSKRSNQRRRQRRKSPGIAA